MSRLSRQPPRPRARLCDQAPAGQGQPLARELKRWSRPARPSPRKSSDFNRNVWSSSSSPEKASFSEMLAPSEELDVAGFSSAACGS